MNFFWAFMSIVAFAQFVKSTSDPIVQTNSGSVRGTTLQSRNGRSYNAFRGIPYAQPPIAAHRFKAPQKATPWSTVFDATKDGPFCIQKNTLFANATVIGQEDCLNLNVYVPVGANNSLPVIVFIHWGAFFAGRGSSGYLGAEYLMDQDVILVTFNYRLGALGFLTTLDDEAPGNYALKDQVLALRWVKDNICNFGGDNQKVTIYGQSAGAASTHYHLLSKLSKGLFQQAITSSGSALAIWASPTNLQQTAVLQAQASFVGCQSFIGNNSQLINCLRNVAADELVLSSDKFKYFFTEPLTAFTMVVEKKTERNPEPFFTETPLEIIQSGNFQKVPWIIGTVENEGILRSAPLLRQSKIRNDMNANFKNLLPQLMYLSISTSNVTALYENVTEKYLKGEDKVDISDPSQIDGFTNLYSDRGFLYSTYQSIMLHATKGHDSIWMYKFNYRGLKSYGDLFAATAENIDYAWGVSHCDDLIYVFNSPDLEFSSLTNHNDLCVSRHLIELWTNFAKFGNPTPFSNYSNYTKWDKVDIQNNTANENLCFLNIEGQHNSAKIQLKMQSGYYPDRMQFWIDQSVNENIPKLFKTSYEP